MRRRSCSMQSLGAISALAAVLLLGGCGGPEVNIESADPYARYLGLLELSQGEPDEQSLQRILRALEDPAFLVREGALRAIIRVRQPGLAARAAPLLTDPHPLARIAACDVLSHFRLGEFAPDLIRRREEDPEGSVRRAAVKALAAIPATPEILRALVAALDDADPSVPLFAQERLAAVSGRKYPASDRGAWEAWLKESR